MPAVLFILIYSQSELIIPLSTSLNMTTCATTILQAIPNDLHINAKRDNRHRNLIALYFYNNSNNVAILLHKEHLNGLNRITTGFLEVRNYSHSTRLKQSCLGIIIYHICVSFDYLNYPYYPDYIG